MDRFNERLKSAMEGSFPAESCMSETEKQQVMERIRSLNGKKPRKARSLFPKIAAAAFLFIAGGVAATELGFLENKTGSNPGSTSFYDGIDPGEYFKGWELVDKSQADNNKKNKSGLMEAKFKGIVELSGTLVYHDDKADEMANRLAFLPDLDSAKRLPTIDGEVGKLAFSYSDAQTVSKLFDITPGATVENVKIEVSSYTVYKRLGEDVADVIKFRRAVELPEPARTYTAKQIRVGADGKLLLSKELHSIYEQYSTKHDDGLLAGLDPFSVFLLYFHADEKEDYATLYSLHNNSPDVTVPFVSIEEFIAESEKSINKEAGKKILETIKSAGAVKEEIRSNGSATIFLNEVDGFGFGLSKDHNGIWKANWLAIQ